MAIGNLFVYLSNIHDLMQAKMDSCYYSLSVSVGPSIVRVLTAGNKPKAWATRAVENVIERVSRSTS